MVTKYNKIEKGSLNAKVKIVTINYIGPQNSALAYEMLESLKSEKNILGILTIKEICLKIS
ncbi:hypothetical protein DIT68_07225 [Brumimicrobium oceani]|uniref:Uncharacterized protein n=1 Tax=Brumimicrobium oceani TaxID=2100725 RepID=A0A2U2XDM4_9FLAO|nr:hypothetical protein DIT68_07225 [Brumimicrobium oceani]